jgi:hypothetical protein
VARQDDDGVMGDADEVDSLLLRKHDEDRSAGDVAWFQVAARFLNERYTSYNLDLGTNANRYKVDSRFQSCRHIYFCRKIDRLLTSSWRSWFWVLEAICMQRRPDLSPAVRKQRVLL